MNTNSSQTNGPDWLTLTREDLIALAQQQNSEIKRLREDLRTALEAYRALLRRQ